MKAGKKETSWQCIYHGGLVGVGGGHLWSHLYVYDIIGLIDLYVYDIIGLIGLATRAGELESQHPSLNKFTSDKNSDTWLN